jgi:hypothetical protein
MVTALQRVLFPLLLLLLLRDGIQPQRQLCYSSRLSHFARA